MFLSCDRVQDHSRITSLAAPTDPLRASLVAAGFRADMIEDRGTYFIVEHDIVIKKTDVRAPTPQRAPSTTEQRRGNYLVDTTFISSLRVKIDNSLSAYTSDITAALTAWNNTGSNVTFSIDQTNPNITIYSDESANCPGDLAYLSDTSTCGMSHFPTSDGYPGDAVSLNYSKLLNLGAGARQTVITHELGHTFGFRHTDDTQYTLIPETPTSDANSIMNLQICGNTVPVDEWDNMSCHLLYPDGKVSVGTSDDLDSYTPPYGYTLPGTLVTTAVVGVDIASGDHVYAWYTDGTVSAGNSFDLDRYAAPYAYTLPPGYATADIAGIAIAASNDHVYVWYRNGYASSGTSSDLDYYAAPYAYTLPSGYTTSSIVDMAINSQDRVYTWYTDGKVSVGTTSDLDYYTAPYTYTPAAGYTPSYIAGIGIARSTSRVYAWYVRKVP
jgi:hypothetical protein